MIGIYIRAALLSLAAVVSVADGGKHTLCSLAPVVVSASGCRYECERIAYHEHSGRAWTWQGRDGYTATAVIVQNVSRRLMRVERPW